MAEIEFTNCDGTAAKRGSHPSRRIVGVNGRRAVTVDVHAHCLVPEAMALLNFRGAERHNLVIAEELRLGEMDSQGIDFEALSINPFWYEAERDIASEVVRIQ